MVVIKGSFTLQSCGEFADQWHHLSSVGERKRTKILDLAKILINSKQQPAGD